MGVKHAHARAHARALAHALTALAPRGGREQAALVACALVALAAHARYMLFVKFDYGWNMSVCLAVGVGQMAAVVAWAYVARHPARRYLAVGIGLMCACTLLEVFDFAPLAGVADAHALFHVASPPVILMWYEFLRRDANHLAEKEL